ncbi:hypothetical protein ACWDG9_40815 [Streptomyces sp. NPDC001073]
MYTRSHILGSESHPPARTVDRDKNTYGYYWARLSDTTGEGSAIIANGDAQGPAVVKIAASDKAFQTTDCKPGKKIC